MGPDVFAAGVGAVEHESLDRYSGSMVTGERQVLDAVGLRVDSFMHSVDRVVDGVSSLWDAASGALVGYLLHSHALASAQLTAMAGR